MWRLHFLPAALLWYLRLAAAALPSGVGHGVKTYYPHVNQMEAIMAIPRELAGDHEAFVEASNWLIDRLLRETKPAPYVVCAKSSHGRQVLAALQLKASPSAIQPISHTETNGSCFISTSSAANVVSLLNTPGITSSGPLLTTLKLAPGLLDHDADDAVSDVAGMSDADDHSMPLRTTCGAAMIPHNVRGLTIKLAPGVLPLARDPSATRDFISDWHTELMSENVDLFATNYWSDPDLKHTDMLRAHLAREWSRAAAVVHESADVHKKTPGEICGLGGLRLAHVDNDLVLVTGMDHLLSKKSVKPDKEEIKMACLMGLLSEMAAKPEVMRVAALHEASLHNAVASAVTQSATTNETPLQDAGLDGTGEVIQVVDSGLDETSCFFADADGLEVEHGHMFKGLRQDNYLYYSSVGAYDFPHDMSRRKVVQYIELFNTADETDDSSSTGPAASRTSDDDLFISYTDFYRGETSWYSWYSSSYWSYTSYWYSSGTSFCAGAIANASYYINSPSSSAASSLSSSMVGGFHKDKAQGHGTHTAGTAAGSAMAGGPHLVEECTGDDRVLGCAGGCMSSGDLSELRENDVFDLATSCPAYDCDGGTDVSSCLGNDTIQTLIDNRGVAPGSKIAIFDVSYDEYSFYPDEAGNHLWTASLKTGAKIHTNSWARDSYCEVTEMEILYDTFMYQNPEHLLIFAAGNSGGIENGTYADFYDCTIGSPALAKNILAVGSTSAGASRSPYTGADGRARYESLGYSVYTPDGYPWICLEPALGLPSASKEPADIDTVSFFSSYGPTSDGRIKPEIVAPGERVFSPSSDGTDSHTCELLAMTGTSMATPVVAGASALVRQYFRNASFYAHDVEARGLCAGESSNIVCSPFSPSAATVKAMLLNSANLMGGGSEPDKYRGFGRVHLEAGMPLNGDGALVLFVTEKVIAPNEEHAYTFDVDVGAGLDLRATLCWIDVPATAFTTSQLLHDLDLSVSTPSGGNYTMWASGMKDTVNVNERVIVPASSLESGMYTVSVSSGELLTYSQNYSLVVTGAVTIGDVGNMSVQGVEAGASWTVDSSSIGWLFSTVALIFSEMWSCYM